MAQYDPLNYVAIMVHICDTFELSHPQMMTLREKVFKTFHSQPIGYSKKTKPPVTLNAVAITIGLVIAFGGYAAALKVARDYDPYAETPEERKAMHKRARQFIKQMRAG
jgi:hypothetical protein